MKRYDWNGLQDFLAVARTGRLTQAAAQLGADHTTVSRRIRALEDSLKTHLFDRSPQGYALTLQGEKLLTAAEAMESLALHAQAEVGEANLAVSGVVRIGAPEGFGSYFLAPRMAMLADTHPQLEIQLVAIPGLVSLSKREADIAITLSPPREGRLVQRKLTQYTLGLYGAPVYLEAHPPILSRSDLGQHRFIGYIEELLYAPELNYMQATDVEIHVGLKSSNLIAQLQAAIAGAGLCVLPEFIAQGRTDLVRVLPDKVGLERSFWLVIHDDLRELARIRTVADFIQDQVKQNRALFQG